MGACGGGEALDGELIPRRPGPEPFQTDEVAALVPVAHEALVCPEDAPGRRNGGGPGVIILQAVPDPAGALDLDQRAPRHVQRLGNERLGVRHTGTGSKAATAPCSSCSSSSFSSRSRRSRRSRREGGPPAVKVGVDGGPDDGVVGLDVVRRGDLVGHDRDEPLDGLPRGVLGHVGPDHGARRAGVRVEVQELPVFREGRRVRAAGAGSAGSRLEDLRVDPLPVKVDMDPAEGEHRPHARAVVLMQDRPGHRGGHRPAVGRRRGRRRGAEQGVVGLDGVLLRGGDALEERVESHRHPTHDVAAGGIAGAARRTTMAMAMAVCSTGGIATAGTVHGVVDRVVDAAEDLHVVADDDDVDDRVGGVDGRELGLGVPQALPHAVQLTHLLRPARRRRRDHARDPGLGRLEVRRGRFDGRFRPGPPVQRHLTSLGLIRRRVLPLAPLLPPAAAAAAAAAATLAGRESRPERVHGPCRAPCVGVVVDPERAIAVSAVLVVVVAVAVAGLNLQLLTARRFLGLVVAVVVAAEQKVVAERRGEL